MIAALARLLPRPLRMCHLAASDTLLRWYWRLVRWHWAYPRRSGRLSVDARLTALIRQMAPETRAGYSESRANCSG